MYIYFRMYSIYLHVFQDALHMAQFTECKHPSAACLVAPFWRSCHSYLAARPWSGGRSGRLPPGFDFKKPLWRSHRFFTTPWGSPSPNPQQKQTTSLHQSLGIQLWEFFLVPKMTCCKWSKAWPTSDCFVFSQQVRIPPSSWRKMVCQVGDHGEPPGKGRRCHTSGSFGGVGYAIAAIAWAVRTGEVEIEHILSFEMVDS